MDESDMEYIRVLSEFLTIDILKRSIFSLPPTGKRYCFPNRFKLQTFSHEQTITYILNRLIEPEKDIYSPGVKESVRRWLSYFNILRILAAFSELLPSSLSRKLDFASFLKESWVETLKNIPKPYHPCSFSFRNIIRLLQHTNRYSMIVKQLQQMSAFLVVSALHLILQDFVSQVSRRMSQTLLNLSIVTGHGDWEMVDSYVSPSSSFTILGHPYRLKESDLFTNKIQIYLRTNNNVAFFPIKTTQDDLFIRQGATWIHVDRIDVASFNKEIRLLNTIWCLLQKLGIYTDVCHLIVKYGFPPFWVTVSDFVTINNKHIF